jgi:uncharacterized membrane protein
MGDVVKIPEAWADAEEDHALRRWTPILLRSIVIVSMSVLSAGLLLTATIAPAHFEGRYREVQMGHLIGRESFATLLSQLFAGQPHAVTTTGLFLLTLVPLARVAFCLFLFIRTRDFAYVGITAYFFAALILGLLLGRIG